MTTKPLAEITEEALTLLYRELGVVDTVCSLNQYGTAYGDYTRERDMLLADLTLGDLASKVEGYRNGS